MKYKKIILETLKYIDNEFNKMNRSITNASIVDRYLIASTFKALRITDAIILLCENNHTDEALIQLRSLIEHSINMRWISSKDTEKRLKEYLSDLGKDGFGKEWTQTRLPDRMKQIGFDNNDYFEFCVKLTYAFAHVNATSLRWGEVYDEPSLKNEKWPSEGIYQVVIQMLGHVILSLHTKYDNYFKDYEKIWSQVAVDKDIRSKIETLKRLLEDQKFDSKD